MALYGMTPTGFRAKTSAEVFAEATQKQRDAIGPKWRGAVLSAAGVVNSIFATQIAEVWAALGAIAQQFTREGAEGRALDTVGAFTATQRKGRTRSRVYCTCTLTGGVEVPAGALIATVAGAGSRFRNAFAFTVPGSGAVSVPEVLFESESFGPVLAPAGTLTGLGVTLPYWSSVTNPADATPGALREKDADFRVSQVRDIGDGSGPMAAIRRAIEATGATSVAILANPTDSEVDGLPARSIEPVVLGGSDSDVATAILGAKSPGVPSTGNTLVVVSAVDGVAHAIGFSRPTGLPIYFQVSVRVGTGFSGVDGIKDAIVAGSSAHYAPGADVSPFFMAALALPVAGVVEVVSFGASTSPGGPFTTAAIAVDARRQAQFSTARVAVTVVP